ncbi:MULTISPECIES: hypothetical protein [unclassified Kribbella]|uniref:hypothetical protein n=1 Tax=unclassified Kribbella TaxID=2644121 RepID=UPI0033CC4F63
MNGRTAQESRLPRNGTTAANGTNGHGPQSGPHAGRTTPAGQGDQEAEQEPTGQASEGPAPEGQETVVKTPAWVEEYAARRAGRVANGTARAEFETPVRVDEIALAAKTLSENLQAATRGMPESPELRALRRDLDHAASTLGSVAGALEATAGNLIRLAASEGQACGVGWGVCPEHGLTLMNVGETVTCHVLGCHRENEGAVERCGHPVAYRVVDAAGPALHTCAGHAIACRLYLDDAVITLASDSLELF